MSCGVPCVSMDCPRGPREIIKDGVNGLLSKDGDVEDLSVKMEWMIVHNIERKKMGQAAREFASTRQLQVVMKEWIRLYNICIDK